MMRLLTRCFIVAVPLCILFASNSWAAFTFSPVKLRIKPGKASAALTVTNPGDKAVLMQVETLRWNQKGGVDVLEATDDLLAVPPVFSVPPHKTQVVRIGLAGQKPTEKEAAYRLFLTEIPERGKGLEKAAVVGIAMRVNLPFFVRPQKTQKALVWDAKPVNQNTLALNIFNSGNTHAHIKKIALFSHPDRTPLAPEKVETFYLLSDQNRSWTFNLEKPASGSIVVVYDDVEQGSKEVVLELNKLPTEPAASKPH